MKHSDWLFLFMSRLLTNKSAQFQHSTATLLFNLAETDHPVNVDTFLKRAIPLFFYFRLFYKHLTVHMFNKSC